MTLVVTAVMSFLLFLQFQTGDANGYSSRESHPKMFWLICSVEIIVAVGGVVGAVYEFFFRA